MACGDVSIRFSIVFICIAAAVCILALFQNNFVRSSLHTMHLPYAKRLFNHSKTETLESPILSISPAIISTTIKPTLIVTTEKVRIMPRTRPQPKLTTCRSTLRQLSLYEKVLNLSRPLRQKLNNTNGKILLMRSVGGRLGNQMFQIASAYGIARRNNRTLVSLGHFDAFDRFQMSIYKVKLQGAGIIPMPARQRTMFDLRIYNLTGLECEQVVRVEIIPNSWKYFGDVQDEIKHMFQFPAAIISRVQAFFRPLIASYGNNIVKNYTSAGFVNNSSKIFVSSSNSNSSNLTTAGATSKRTTTYIGVHVRRGDTVPGHTRIKNTDFTPGGADYVARAMLYYVTRYSDVTFVVCSDDIRWCQKNIRLQNINSYVANNNSMFVDLSSYRIVYCDRKNPPVLDMAILAACNHTIMTGGTFGWWSAYLAGGHNVYYLGCPRSKSKNTGFFAPDSPHFLPHWVGIW